MSIESMAIVLHHSQAADKDFRVLIGIANHEGDGGAFPSIATLAKYARCSTRTAQRIVKRLQALGEITVEIQGGGTFEQRRTGRATNLYRIRLKCPPGCDGTSKHQVLTGDSQVSPHPRHLAVTPPMTPGCHPSPDT